MLNIVKKAIIKKTIEIAKKTVENVVNNKSQQDTNKNNKKEKKHD